MWRMLQLASRRARTEYLTHGPSLQTERRAKQEGVVPYPVASKTADSPAVLPCVCARRQFRRLKTAAYECEGVARTKNHSAFG